MDNILQPTEKTTSVIENLIVAVVCNISFFVVPYYLTGVWWQSLLLTSSFFIGAAFVVVPLMSIVDSSFKISSEMADGFNKFLSCISQEQEKLVKAKKAKKATSK